MVYRVRRIPAGPNDAYDLIGFRVAIGHHSPMP